MLGYIQLIFNLPYIWIRGVYIIFTKAVLKKNLNADAVGEGKYSYLISGLIWIILISWFIYQNQFTHITYVYACPQTNTSKCYKLKADYIPKDCEATEWDNRGAHGGNCTDPSIGKIYFDNEGYITFDYCDMESKGKWTCFAEDRKDGTWDIEISETVKVRK